MMKVALEHHKAGRRKEARDLYMEILIDDYNNADVWHLLGLIELDEGREEGFEMMHKALQLAPISPIFHANLAHHYKHRENYKKAIEHFLCSYELLPRLEILFEVALLYQILRLPEKALHCYEIIIAKNPSHSQALNNIGVIYAQKGEWNIAQAYFQKALEVKPNYEDACKNITISTNQLQE